MSTSIHQEVVFKVDPKQVYDALLNSKQFSQLSGDAPAQIDGHPGGRFSCFGGMISGRQIELQPNQRIVQAWRARNWPEGMYSIVNIELATHGMGTKLTLNQSGFPADQKEHMERGWRQMYWEPLAKYTEAGRGEPS
jgi:activator of HSP90 ATPase